MSDEIKEYLDTLKEIVGEGKSKGTYGISYWHWKEILDCITNLQQLYDKALNDLVHESHRRMELEQENERLKEENKHIFANVNDDELLISNAMNYAEAQDYKSRVEKAIEVINTQLKNAEGGYKDNLRIIKFNLIKGSCTFEDLKTEDDYKYDGGKDE